MVKDDDVWLKKIQVGSFNPRNVRLLREVIVFRVA
jgi:hypothetical protein